LAQELLLHQVTFHRAGKREGRFGLSANERTPSRLPLGPGKGPTTKGSYAVQSALALGEGVQRAGRLFFCAR